MAAVFGRDPELSLADTFLGVARERFDILLLEGEAGIGKTTVWRETLRRAGEGGFRMLSCRPAATEVGLPGTALADLLEDVPDPALAALPAPQRQAIEIALLRVAPEEGATDLRALAAAVRSLLVILADERPLLVAIDDVQWLDRSSATVVGFALRRIPNTPMGWLLARRQAPRGRLDPHALVEPQALTCMTIGPLALTNLYHVVKAQVDGPLSRSTLVRIQQAADGNPSRALGIARELLRPGAARLDRPERQARHCAGAAPERDEGAAGALEEAAALARARGAWDIAGELLARASSLTPCERPADAHRRGIAAAEHHIHAGDRPSARSLLLQILAQELPRALRADALRLLGEISYNDWNVAQAEQLFGEALAQADDPRLIAAIELDLTYVHAYALDFPGCRMHARRALEQAQAAGDDALTAAALAHTAMYEFLGGGGIDWSVVERSLTLEDPNRLVALQARPTTIAALLLAFSGDLAEARERLMALRAATLARGDESDLGFVLLWLGWVETRRGDLDAAARLADEAEAYAALSGSEAIRAWVLMQRALVQAHLGETRATERDCEEATELAASLGYTMPTIWIAASRGVLALSRGDAAAAWQACAHLTSMLETHGIGEPVTAFFLPDAIEALIAIGELGRAEALLDAFEQRGRELDRAWALATAARCRALLLAASRDLPGAMAAVEHAHAEHRRMEMPFELARTLLVESAIHRRSRRRTQARAALHQALAIFEEIGAARWAQRTRAELERFAIRRVTADQLTEAEWRVAQLAAQGLPNREVAAMLFVSQKTVEAQLARAYRKLGINSRAQLGARMAELAAEP